VWQADWNKDNSRKWRALWFICDAIATSAALPSYTSMTASAGLNSLNIRATISGGLPTSFHLRRSRSVETKSFASVCSTRSTRVDGYLAHQTVAMDHWCVTRDDLRKLRSAVQDAIRQGHITPTELDDFDPEDDRYGPCVHTVNHQLIKPVTHMAGKQSWALMNHPVGLKCDLFITHSWAEGIYEFIDKALNSWPHRAKHAYCCMLCNPQNLDIGDLIASPIESPFAQALGSATHMLVIPNRKESIYCRIWCAYEVYLAYKWRKTIFVAHFPIKGLWKELFVALVLALGSLAVFSSLPHSWILLGVSTCSEQNKKASCGLMNYLLFICILLGVGLTTLVPPRLALRCVNYAALVVNSAWFVVLRQIGRLSGFVVILIYISLVGFFLGSEADRMRMVEAIREAENLRRGFTGRCRDAKSTIEEDKESILAEIGDSGAAVDDAIAVLLRAGMSTSSLRNAAKRGVNIKNAGRFRMSLLIAGISVWSVWGAVGLNRDSAESRVLGAIILVQALVFLVLLYFLTYDSRAFAANTAFKLMCIVPFLGFRATLWSLDLHLHLMNPEDMIDEALHKAFPWVFACGILTVLVGCVLGLEGTAAIPLAGPWLARFILANSCGAWWELCCCGRGTPRAVEAIDMLDASMIMGSWPSASASLGNSSFLVSDIEMLRSDSNVSASPLANIPDWRSERPASTPLPQRDTEPRVSQDGSQSEKVQSVARKGTSISALKRLRFATTDSEVSDHSPFAIARPKLQTSATCSFESNAGVASDDEELAMDASRLQKSSAQIAVDDGFVPMGKTASELAAPTQQDDLPAKAPSRPFLDRQVSFEIEVVEPEWAVLPKGPPNQSFEVGGTDSRSTDNIF